MEPWNSSTKQFPHPASSPRSSTSLDCYLFQALECSLYGELALLRAPGAELETMEAYLRRRQAQWMTAVFEMHSVYGR